MQLPVHAEAFGKFGHRGMHGLQRQAGIAVEMHAQEEAATFLVAELLGVEDVAAVVEQQAGHSVDDTGTVGAGQGEDGIGAHLHSVGQLPAQQPDDHRCNRTAWFSPKRYLAITVASWSVMNLLQLIRSFTRTAETGSIAAAARILGISATAVGQNINRLEAHLGVRLLNRSTRQLALSEAGALYLAQVRHIEGDLARAQAMVTAGDIEPVGPLRIASSSAFGHVLAPLLPSLQQRYPQLQLELRLTDRAVQHGPEAVDASIRIGAQLEDGVVARQLARVPFVFCASPTYLKTHGTPQEPSDLGSHRGLLHRFPTDGRRCAGAC